ncbi:unnamed protein product [Parnassius apollo]|uniref:(apollo) hypothetical protein n=1 Tax=Parnassius apollo TaxID=110799 RepID=A0A8S3XJ19_PARAO|nr:unnamed protein product [Parnassius apollo]
MNGLTLRISGSSSKKIKGTLAYTPVIIPKHLLAKTGDENILVEKFQKCHSVDEQLSVLKENLHTSDVMTLNFLVIIFLLAEMKHPVKCFLVRYISKNNNLQESFSKALASEILSYISVKNVDCKVYMEIIPRIASCIENFPAGGMAIKQIKVELSEYLAQCLQCCVETLRYMKSLSPTEKNELFNLAHLTLRMLLYIVQKVTFHNTAEITSTFSALRLNIKELLFDEEVPMDTKSVCGILLISMYNLQERSNAWIEILKSEVTDWEFNSLMENDSAKLSLYSAITTVVPTPELITMSVGPESALIKLTYNILAIGEKTSSDSTFTLSVTRTLVQISKTLSKTSDRNLGLQLVDCLLTFVWSHLEHYMDSVRHLTGQVLANIVRYCTELKKEGDDKALDRLFTALMSLDRSRKSYYVSLTSLTSELGASCILGRMPNAICDTIKALDIQAVQASNKGDKRVHSRPLDGYNCA